MEEDHVFIHSCLCVHSRLHDLSWPLPHLPQLLPLSSHGPRGICVDLVAGRAFASTHSHLLCGDVQRSHPSDLEADSWRLAILWHYTRPPYLVLMFASLRKRGHVRSDTQETANSQPTPRPHRSHPAEAILQCVNIPFVKGWHSSSRYSPVSVLSKALAGVEDKHTL